MRFVGQQNVGQRKDVVRPTRLKWRWGNPALWAVFIGVSVFLLRFLKKNKWI